MSCRKSGIYVCRDKGCRMSGTALNLAHVRTAQELMPGGGYRGRALRPLLCTTREFGKTSEECMSSTASVPLQEVRQRRVQTKLWQTETRRVGAFGGCQHQDTQPAAPGSVLPVSPPGCRAAELRPAGEAVCAAADTAAAEPDRKANLK